MLIYHQCGHNFIWNIESLRDDKAGEGCIISPVNVPADRIQDRFPEQILKRSWLDPQFYLPADDKGQLGTYPFFPANVLDEFSTGDYHAHAHEVAKTCLKFQNSLGLKYLVLPTRYYEDLPDGHLEQLGTHYVEPFINAKAELGLRQPLLLTVIAKPLHLEPGRQRDDLLSWATGYADVSGVYLIFDNNFRSKQIKDAKYLSDAMKFIRTLRRNDLEVHLGYSGVEGLLFSIADPTSVSVGSYENLRRFSITRLETTDPRQHRPPNPRVYSGRLLQWIEDSYLSAMREIVPNWKDLFDDSPYKEYLLDPKTSLNFQRSEIYKHYFVLFSNQVASLPDLSDRPGFIRKRVLEAMSYFEQIEDHGMYFDHDSDGSHLPAWLNALTLYQL